MGLWGRGVARELWGYVIWGAMFDIRQLGYRLLWGRGGSKRVMGLCYMGCHV